MLVKRWRERRRRSQLDVSIAAQIVEANPSLKPHQVKSILVETAARLPQVPVDRQGWGVVNPKRAVERAAALASTDREVVGVG